MKKKKPNEIVFDSVDEGRREFVKKLVAGTAFAAPLLASFSMDGALVGEAEAAAPYYGVPYCGSLDVSYRFKAQFRSGDNSVRFNATVVADVMEYGSLTVIVNFMPRNEFNYAELLDKYTAQTFGGSLQLGPNVIPNSESFNLSCGLLENLSSPEPDYGGKIIVHTYNLGDFSADLEPLG